MRGVRVKSRFEVWGKPVERSRVSVRSNFGIIDREGPLALNGGLTLASFRCAIGRRRAGWVAFALAFALSNIKNGDKE
jgi:hypothetical protein